jgi:hypothetical protein
MHDTLRSGLASLFSDDPALAFELATRMGAPALGPGAIHVRAPRTLVDPLDPERKLDADLVLVAYEMLAGERVPVAALAIEVLLTRDERRVDLWDLVPRALRRSYGCYGQVFVVSPVADVRAWLGERIAKPATPTSGRLH